MAEIMKVVIVKCRKCGYSWVPRTTRIPRQCPKCWSYKWREAKK